jgi:hypothetical protein
MFPGSYGGENHCFVGHKPERRGLVMGRVLLAGVLSGIVVFIWGAIAHMLLPLGTMGISILAAEDDVLGSISKAVGQPGFYFFPGQDMG